MASGKKVLLSLFAVVLISGNCFARGSYLSWRLFSKTSSGGEAKVETKRAETRESNSSNGIIHGIIYYLPNRILDLVDCLTVEIGGGANAEIELQITRYFALGAGYGGATFVGWDTGRQVGYYGQMKNNLNLIGLCIEDIDRQFAGLTYQCWTAKNRSIFDDGRTCHILRKAVSREDDVRDRWAREGGVARTGVERQKNRGRRDAHGKRNRPTGSSRPGGFYCGIGLTPVWRISPDRRSWSARRWRLR